MKETFSGLIGLGGFADRATLSPLVIISPVILFLVIILPALLRLVIISPVILFLAIILPVLLRLVIISPVILFLVIILPALLLLIIISPVILFLEIILPALLLLVIIAHGCGIANSATPCDCVRRAIGRVSDGGWSRDASMGGVVIVVGGSLRTLGSC